MRELPEFAELRAAWLNQPEEEIPVDIERIHRRRTWELFSTTRSEIISSIGAALFFAGIVAWRFALERDRLVLFGCAGVIVWAAVTVFRFRVLNPAPHAPIGRPCQNRPGALPRGIAAPPRPPAKRVDMARPIVAGLYPLRRNSH